VKDLRADVVKGRFVPVFVHASFRGERDREVFPHDLSYTMDGIIEMRFDGDFAQGYALKRLCVREMRGVPTISKWIRYEYDANRGLVRTDPLPDSGAGGGAVSGGPNPGAGTQSPPGPPDRG